MTGYTVEYDRDAKRELERLPPRVRTLLDEAIVELAAKPRPHGTTKLKGYAARYRIRSGSYRVVYEIDDTNRTILVVTLGHRSSVYKSMTLAFLLLSLPSE